MPHHCGLVGWLIHASLPPGREKWHNERNVRMKEPRSSMDSLYCAISDMSGIGELITCIILAQAGISRRNLRVGTQDRYMIYLRYWTRYLGQVSKQRHDALSATSAAIRAGRLPDSGKQWISRLIIGCELSLRVCTSCLRADETQRTQAYVSTARITAFLSHRQCPGYQLLKQACPKSKRGSRDGGMRWMYAKRQDIRMVQLMMVCTTGADENLFGPGPGRPASCESKCI
ncbi:hypothetical protein PspLS_02588 [Pyricularia sp. CBS 133598]|nr:hypothetical protein PspLS_02588 [Pyricularia sp. CBS 133598]